MDYFLSLGSNLGNRKKNLSMAIDFLRQRGKIDKISSIYETNPLKMPIGSRLFLNAALGFKSFYGPFSLLAEIKKFEKIMERKSSSHHHQPRKIDIDILLCRNLIIWTKSLCIPHQQMTDRRFVLEPLAEIYPRLIHPLKKKTIKSLLNGLHSDEKVKKVFSATALISIVS